MAKNMIKIKKMKEVEKTNTNSAKKEDGGKNRKFLNLFSNYVGVDLGTSSTVVHINGKGLILKEPTLVAINRDTEQVIAIGKKARLMIGRTPDHIDVVQPVQCGVIFDYEVAEQLFEYIFRKVQDKVPKMFNPTVVVGVPCCTSKTEVHAVRDAVIDSCTNKVHIVYEPLAAAIGLGLKFDKETSCMVIDIGGGTSDSMVLVDGEIVASNSIRIAGDDFNKAIIEGLIEKSKIIIGERTAEDLKMAIMQSNGVNKKISVQGRSATNGLPLESDVSFEEILKFISPKLDEIVDHVNKFVKSFSPEVLADLQNGCIYFVGGGSLINTFREKIEKSLNLEISIPENHMTAVAQGASIIAKNPKKYKKYFL